MDIAVADQAEHITTLVGALLEWHALICRRRREAGDDVALRVALRRLREAFDPFVVVGFSTNKPKFHRAKDIPDIIRLYGCARFVSTDVYEMTHKNLKRVIAR